MRIRRSHYHWFLTHIGLLVFFSFLILNSPVFAQSFSNEKALGKKIKSTSITVGYGFFSSSRYEGGKGHTVRSAPFFSLAHKNLSINPISGFRLRLIDRESWSGGIGVGGSFGRYAKQDPYLSDLGNISWTMEGIIFGKYKAKYYSFTSEIYRDLLQKGHGGYYWKNSLGTGLPLLNLRIFVRPSLSITYADINYMNSFFGVNSSQSFSSGYSEYTLNQGIKDISAAKLVVYRFSEKVNLSGTLAYKELMASVAKSPIVQNKGQFSAGLTLTYLY